MLMSPSHSEESLKVTSNAATRQSMSCGHHSWLLPRSPTGCAALAGAGPRLQ